jgi:hypothetical protein
VRKYERRGRRCDGMRMSRRIERNCWSSRRKKQDLLCRCPQGALPQIYRSCPGSCIPLHRSVRRCPLHRAHSDRIPICTPRSTHPYPIDSHHHTAPQNQSPRSHSRECSPGHRPCSLALRHHTPHSPA